MRGGYGKGSGVPLWQRRNSAAPAAGVGRPAHCWVSEPPGHPGTWPGLLVEWRRDTEGWTGRVVFVVGGAVVVETWLPSDQLST